MAELHLSPVEDLLLKEIRKAQDKVDNIEASTLTFISKTMLNEQSICYLKEDIKIHKDNHKWAITTTISLAVLFSGLLTILLKFII